jgi:glycosyltransferase involved in cell wall biosynthesis
VTAETVSVVIPARDGEQHLVEAIESVLAQSRPPDEVVVVDDGSTDGTAAVARGFGAQVVVVSQPQLGVAPAVNRGVQESRGTLLAFVDADDLWLPGKLELQLTALRERAELEAVFGHAVQFGDGGQTRRRFRATCAGRR